MDTLGKVDKNFKKVQKHFHRHADYLRFFNRLDNPFIQKKEVVLAKRILEDLRRESKVLEVGCGEGSNLYYLNRLGREISVTGIDFSAEKVSFMCSLMPNVYGITADATNLPVGDNQYNLVLLRDLLHHVNWARKEVLNEAVRVTEPGGHVIIIESLPDSILNKIFILMYPEERGMKDSTIKRLKKLCAPYFYKMETCEKTYLLRAVSFVFGWPKGWGKLFLYPFYIAVQMCETILKFFCPNSCSNVIIKISVE